MNVNAVVALIAQVAVFKFKIAIALANMDAVRRGGNVPLFKVGQCDFKSVKPKMTAVSVHMNAKSRHGIKRHVFKSDMFRAGQAERPAVIHKVAD